MRIALAAVLLLATCAAAEELPTGRVVEKVACSESPSNSYALYLPSGYTPARKWPIVYAMDARGVALDPMAAFREAAERRGVIIVSSYDTASDTEIRPSVAALQAMWNDTHRRLAIDDRRAYLAGFSGTVRIACYLAFAKPGSIAGIIGAGAGFPSDRPPDRETSFLFFGTAGTTDFNYLELNTLDSLLTSLHLPHRIEYFAGTHEWMPPNLAAEALDWMELRAMEAGTREKDDKLVEAFWSADLGRAEALEVSDDLVDATRLYTAMTADYAKLRNVSAAAAAASRVQQSAGYAPKLKARQHALESEGKAIARAQNILTTTADAERAIDLLRITALRKEAAGTGEQSLASKRVLAALFGQTGFYIPREMREKKKYSRAVFFLTIAAAIRPEEPWVHYNLAAMHALANERRESLQELQRAVSLGFHDASRLERDEAFAPLRDDEGFKKVLAALARS